MAQQQQGMGYEILGAVKIKDGLFVGDELASQDLEFVVANKVTHIINCCGRQVPNHWEPIGVVYLTYYWVDTDSQTILDHRDVVSNELFQFIEEALENSESVLVHSVRGQSRSCCVLAAYMMRKYSWGLRKTMEFLSARRPDVTLKPAFLQQLSAYERRLMANSKDKFSTDWSNLASLSPNSEEIVLRNTYMNSQMGPLADYDPNVVKQYKRRLTWTDNEQDDKSRLECVAGESRVFPKPANPNPKKILKFPPGWKKSAPVITEEKDEKETPSMHLLEEASRNLSVTQGSNASAQDSTADDMNARLAAAAAEREREQREQREAREREQRQKETELQRQREQEQRERENREREARERRAKEVEEARKARELLAKEKAERDAREAQEAREKAAAEAAQKAAREREAAAEEAKRLQEAAAATPYSAENYSDQAPASSDQPTSTATTFPPSTAPRAQRSSFSSDMDSDDRQNSFSSQQKERPSTAGYDETRDRRPTVGSVLGGSTSSGANRQNPYSDRLSDREREIRSSHAHGGRYSDRGERDSHSGSQSNLRVQGRDSGYAQRRESPIRRAPSPKTGLRPPRRDPSPRTSDGYSHRGDGSPSQRTRVGDAYRQGSPSKRNSGRGESPLRVMRGSNDSHRLDPMRNNRYGSSSNSLAFNLNMGNALRPAPNTGGRINSGMSMDSMRQNGPVKARADVLGSAMVGPSSNSLNRRVPGQRPSTAPIGSRNSRPSSPAGRIGSRPSTPPTRPLSPGTNLRPGSPGSHRNSLASGVLGIRQSSNVYFDSKPMSRRPTSLYAQGRRAPSPSPHFNRNQQSGGQMVQKPRWRM